MNPNFAIEGRAVGPDEPTYFIAEVGANFDGNLDEARRLVDLAIEADADAVKFQSFLADNIVSDHSFRNLQLGFQAKWKKSTYEVYQEAHFPREWHQEIADYAKEQGITFFSSPYDADAVELLDSMDTPAFKIGSGDINWLDMVELIGSKGRPVLLATGAAPMAEVDEAVRTLERSGCEALCLMQCTTNYPSHFESANLRVLDTFATAFPNALLGFSDHTPGDVAVLGAIARGARVIEKHFTSDRNRVGPDHPHSMEPAEFKAMVQRTRHLELALGSSQKVVVEEEAETSIIQRRSLHAARAIKEGEVIGAKDLKPLRPAIGIPMAQQEGVLGRRAVRDLEAGEAIRWADLQ